MKNFKLGRISRLALSGEQAPPCYERNEIINSAYYPPLCAPVLTDGSEMVKNT